ILFYNGNKQLYALLTHHPNAAVLSLVQHCHHIGYLIGKAVMDKSVGLRGRSMDLFSLKGKKAVLLGGGGILGAAMVKGLVDAGADVAVCDLDLERAQAVADSVIS